MKKNMISPYSFPGIRPVDLFILKFPHIKRIPDITVSELFEIVAREKNLTIDEIVSKSRSRQNIEARQIIYKAMRERLNLTLKDIGERFGSRDHTTVMHNLRVFENDYYTCENFRERVDPILKKLGLIK